jgi:ankyrin repeat protein
LHIAASRTDPEIAALLLDHGADPHRRTDQGETALAIALARDRPAVAGLLRRHAATV